MFGELWTHNHWHPFVHGRRFNAAELQMLVRITGLNLKDFRRIDT
jgi:hypothetical protein